MEEIDMENKSKKETRRYSKIWEWLNSKHEPTVDLSKMSEREIKAMYRAILR